MLLFQQSEATAAQRRFPVYLVDATDGITPETGEAAGQPQVSKQGGAWGNTTATLTAVGNGMYYVELTATELNTVGLLAVRYKSANTAEYNLHAMVVPWDPYDAVRAGLTALPNANAEAAGGLYTRGTGAGQINQTTNGRVDTTVQANNDKTGYSISGTKTTLDALNDPTVAAIADGVWDEAKSGHVGAGSFGEEVQAHALSTEISALNDPSAATIADAVWDEAKAGHVGVGSFGEEVQSHALSSEISALNDIAAADVWAVATRVLTANTNLNDPTAAAIADAVWDEATAGHAAAGSTGKALTDVLDDTGTSGVVIASATQDAIADAYLDRSNGVETGTTPRQFMRLAAAALYGKAAGLATTSATYRNEADTLNRITATVDADGNRTAVTLNKT